MTNISTPIQNLFFRLINIGITDSLDFTKKRTIRILNLICILGGTASTIFLVSNVLQHHYLLAATNFITLLAEISLLVSNYYKRYQAGNFIMSVLVSVVFAVSSILFNNNMEFYLLLIIGLNLILIDDLKVIIFFSVVNTAGFLLIYQYGHTHEYYPPVSDTRRYINIILWVIFFIVFLQFFKKQNLSYQKEIETKNELLEIQQEQLVDQKIQLEDNNEELVKLNQTKEKLFSIIAHDLRLPIGSLKSALMLFNSQIINKEDFSKLAGELTLQVDALHNNLDNLLHWSHSQLNGINATPERFTLQPVILQTLSLLSGNLQQKQLKVEQHINDNLMVYADVNHVTLILRNLLTNAIKFSHSGDSIEVHASTVANNQIAITITDYGVGMDTEKHNSLFKPNPMNSVSGTKNEKGTGLGLNLCKEFVQKNNGTISVISTLGKGSSFTITLPSA
jgi:signal transduction histidine kinase